MNTRNVAGQMPALAPSLAFLFWLAYGLKQFSERLLAPLGGGAGGVAWTAFLIALLLCMSILVLGNSVKLRRNRTASAAVPAFVLWSGAALGWYQGADGFAAFGYWLTMAIEVLVCYVLLMSARSSSEVVRASLAGLVLGGVIYGLYALLQASSVGMSRLGDDSTLQTNFVGAYMAISGLCSLFLSLTSEGRRRVLWLFAAAILVALLVRSFSKTAILAFATSLALFILLARVGVRSRAMVVGVAVLGAAVFYGAFQEYLLDYLDNTQGGEALESLSGRRVIWSEFVGLIQIRPLLGYGFFSVREFAPPIAASLGHATAHNELLTLWFTLGLPGVAAAAAAYSVLLVKGIRASIKGYSSGALIVGLTFFALMRGYTEAVSYGLVLPLPLIVVLLALLSDRKLAGKTQS